MKKIFSTAILLLLVCNCFACDICGCSSGNYFIGPFPKFKKHFAGIRYSFRRFESQEAADPDEFSKDFYQTIELYGAASIGKRWQVMAFVPYNINRQVMDAHIHHHKGVGDISLLANYSLLQQRAAKFEHQLMIGAGIKLPTGHFNPSFDNHPVPNANVEPGTGSTDFIFNATDMLQVGKWGLFSNMNYKINGDAKNFQFGNRFNASAFVYRSFGNRISVRPNAGLLYEHLAANKLEGEEIDQTGGHALLSSIGIETAFGKISIGTNFQLPVAQNLSKNQTDAGLRGSLQCIVSF